MSIYEINGKFVLFSDEETQKMHKDHATAAQIRLWYMRQRKQFRAKNKGFTQPRLVIAA